MIPSPNWFVALRHELHIRMSRPRFHLHGDWIVFETDRVPMKILATGGTPRTLADSGTGVSWGDRDVLVLPEGRVALGRHIRRA